MLRGIGKPATVNVLFCRDLIDEADHQENYLSPCRSVSVDQLIKLMIIYELHGLSDVALDTATRFADRLAERLDVGRAVYLLADPFCRKRRLGLRALMLPKQALRQAAYLALRPFVFVKNGHNARSR